jgi:hypothetical protein
MTNGTFALIATTTNNTNTTTIIVFGNSSLNDGKDAGQTWPYRWDYLPCKSLVVYLVF